MPSLCFPQLSSGTLAQYPIRKTYMTRTLENTLLDGSVIALPDPAATRKIWQLAYTDLEAPDVSALAALYQKCSGRLLPFIFIDPTDNMLQNSEDLTGAGWSPNPSIGIIPGIADPVGGAAAFLVTNTSQSVQNLSQTLAVPSSYQYCLSIFARSPQVSSVGMALSGSNALMSSILSIGPDWRRLVISSRLSDSSSSYSASIELSPGQQVMLYGPQLEAQPAPSDYRSTSNVSGVYASAFWAVDQLPFSADAPGLYSTRFSIETGV